ncbi:DUF4013 domain-containing protein [Natronorarus salvus]|uniref:DUF4013 domain-containing protein n=1 Tax=Natronorarus salvus TaxID=3117733 RepID=UPI002F26A9F4
MLGEALTYPRRGDDWIRRTLLGGLCILLGVFGLPLLLLAGYALRVLDRPDRGEPPAFGDWFDLFEEGARAVVLAFAYTLVPAVVLTLSVLAANAGFGTLGGLLALSTLGLYLLALYVLPVGLLHSYREGTLGASLDVEHVRSTCLDARYARAWALAAALSLLGLLATVSLGLVIVGGFVGFLIFLGAWRALSLGIAAVE